MRVVCVSGCGAGGGRVEGREPGAAVSDRRSAGPEQEPREQPHPAGQALRPGEGAAGR